MANDDKKADAPEDAMSRTASEPPAAGSTKAGLERKPSEPSSSASPVELKREETKASEPKAAEAQPSQPKSVDPKAAGTERAGFAGSNATDHASAAEPQGAGPSPGSEWTASDDRGPLGRAKEIDETGKAVGEREGTSAAASSAEGADKKPATEGLVPPVDATPGTPSGSRDGASPSPVSPASMAGPTAAEQKRSLWPVAAALIIGAVIGAGSAAFVYRGYADDSQPDPQIKSLTTRVDALEKRPDPQSAVAALKSSINALDGQVATIRGSGAKPEAAAPQGASSPAQGADLEPLNQKIAALQASLDSLKSGGANTKALQEKVAALEGTLAGMKSATDRAQTGVSTVETRQKEIAGKVTAPALAVVADSLVQQIDHGQPYAAQVDALAALGANPARVAILRQNAEKGVPSARVLAAKFEPLALPVSATANKAPPNAGLVDRLKSGMFSMVSVRRLDDTSGTDLPSRVARIKTALAHDDVAGALDAWNALPPDARTKADAWAALAKSHADAMNAARALQHDSIVALGTKKS